MSEIRPPIAAPSILSADFARLGEELAIVDPSRDWVHCDIMDHRFVPSLTFGPLIVEAVNRLTTAFLDVHLMVERPEAMAPDFRKAGADEITIHLEACVDPAAALAAVRATGARVGLAIKPATPFDEARPWLDRIDMLLVMTVEPGAGGQAFKPEMLPKVSEARALRERHGHRYLIGVDGGIGPGTARRAAEAGADVFIAGNSVYGKPNPREALEALRAEIGVRSLQR
jgi:ribulose-phosphate 3-epimerase